jgi:hypothetical protein
MEVKADNKENIFSTQKIEPSIDNKFPSNRILNLKLIIVFSIVGIIILGLLIVMGTYVLNSQKVAVTVGNIPTLTPAAMPPTDIPSPTPTQIPTKFPTAIPTRIPTAAPTAIPLAISLHLLDSKTGNPIPGNGIKITINGEGINKTVDNQAEAYFALSSPGTYQVSSNDPSSGYSADEISCSDNSRCHSNLDAFCGSTVDISQGKIDIYCKYRSNGTSNNNPSGSSQSVNLGSIDPNSGSVGSSITLHGSGFGTSNGFVIFYNSNGQDSGGAPIESWSDTQITARVPGILAPNSTYQVEVENSNKSKSNRTSFAVN